MNTSCGNYVVGGPPVSASGGNPYPETEDQARLRFQVELEFVQCLANPNYLNFLAQRGYLKEKPFVNYLQYLLYWKSPEYAAYLKYPQCLHLLELLQYEGFRTEIINTPCAKFIEDQLLLHWQHYPRKRLKLLEQHLATDTSASTAVSAAAANTPASALTQSPSLDAAPSAPTPTGPPPPPPPHTSSMLPKS